MKSFCCSLGAWLCGALASTWAFAAQAQPSDGFSAYRQEMQKMGLRALVPATSAFVPGYIYYLQRTAEGRVFVRTVCEQAFVQPPRVIDIGFPSNQRVRQSGVQGGVQFLPGVLAKKVNAALKLDASDTNDIAITIPRAQTLEVAQRVTAIPGTTELVRRQLRPECAATLATFDRKNGQFVIPMFLVVQATYPLEMTYTLNRSTGASIAIDATASAALEADFGLKASRVNSQSFKLAAGDAAKPLFVAANFVRLQSLNPNTEVSADTQADLGIASVDPSMVPPFETDDPQ